jgi:hypothetical protein
MAGSSSLSSTYNKWDRLEVSDDEDAGSATKRPDRAERFAAHRQGMALVAHWIGEAAAEHGVPAPAGDDLRLLLDFVAAQCVQYPCRLARVRLRCTKRSPQTFA